MTIGWRRQFLAIFFSLALVSSIGQGISRADYVGNKYTDPTTGEVLEYNVFVPTGYDPTKKYPLLVFLHAANNTNPPNRTLSSDGVGWTGTFINTPHQATDPSFFMIPISQTNMGGWGGATDPITTPEKFEGRLTIQVLKSVVMTKYNIDPNRLYITGPSMGGRGTWDIIRRYPDMFAASAPAAAPAGVDDAALYVNQNIWALCGEVDPIVQGERDAVTAIRKAGGNPIYTELAGHGHDSWRTVYPDPQFVPWIYAQRLGVPWWTVSKAPTSITGATLTTGWPTTMPPANLPTSFGGNTGSSAGGAGTVAAGGVTGAGGRAGGGTAGAPGLAGASGPGGSGTASGTGGSVISSTGGAISPSSTGGALGPVATGGAPSSSSGGASPTSPSPTTTPGGPATVPSGSSGGASGAQDTGSGGGGCSLGAGGPGRLSAGSTLLLLSFFAFRRRQNRRSGRTSR